MFSLILEWIHRRGIQLLCYLGDWLVIAESVPLLLQHCKQFLLLYKDLGVAINIVKSDLKLFSMAQYLGMLVDTIRERVFPTDSGCQIRDLVN